MGSAAISTKMKQNRLRQSISEQSDNDQLLHSNINGRNAGYGSLKQQEQQEIVFKEYVDFEEEENMEEEIYKIVENLSELYQAQKDLNDLVYEMDEPIQILVDNTGNVLDNVSAGVVNIEKASKHLKSYRGKLCCVGAAILIIAVIVTIIIVMS